MGLIADSLDRADAAHFTRPMPKSAQKQMQFLVKQTKGTQAAADLLGITQRTVERYLTGQLKQPRRRLANRLAAGATEQQLQDIVAEGLQEIYFKDRGRRAHGLLVDFTDLDYLDVDY
ncbi:hypothetical protein [Streptomyces sp. TLI_185]|uniref:hypothetical protein n=1 Tax=Streptomyces sp. TLI_185 TaxID=2485151 RepID=UPI000F4DD549|nr:hypothetical protein [Streptomyces sp. TLI_185]RPF39351.1 hypothetical protein EDD92_9599 [Streptomyces sp. TLI_185]